MLIYQIFLFLTIILFLRLATRCIEPTPDIIVGVNKEFLAGVAKLEDRLLVLLDLVHVLNLEEKKIAQEVFIQE
ncbi:hypothetical protein [Bacillus dakarensis]|uniref:hypothetical protein n=1 Tax=Robertmurraya dakarensis TaxID=1926278 RepID=UPI000981265E|nr:hypothetical protein [Bacillus dakarensis]